ncbi:MAG TPA: HD domain-containing phosphohydrolase [Methylomirabilota bacterium]|nr:HD domain-containing phosphohydrolase [Methylomirabilota bacterium]
MAHQTIPARARGRLPFWRRLSWRLSASVLLLTALGILVSGLLQYRAQERNLQATMGNFLLNIARTGALLVDGDAHEAVVKAGRTDTAEYAALVTRLRQIQEANRLTDPVYTLVEVEGAAARFAVVSNGQVPVGLPYRLAPEIRPVLNRVMAEGKSGFTGIYTSSSGTWITGFAPILNSAGKPVAALDVDFRADVYVTQLAALRRQLYLSSLVAAVLALAAGILLARRITRPIGELAASARRVVEGDLSTPVRIRARDEIGLLGNVFHLMVDRLHVSHRSMVDVLVRALEARGGEPGGLGRLARAAQAVGERLELTPAQREALELGALLHDIGEIRTPEALLQKAGRLTPEERLVVQAHPQAGVELIETVPLLTPAVDVVGGHHERWDGSGYPHGLKGEEIPFAARIFSVVDALDAMTHPRPHRDARPLAEALEEIRKEAGRQFDPRVAEVALTIPEEQWAALLEVRRG